MNDDIRQKVTKFFSHYPTRTFKKRELIIRAEETPSNIFYIVEGRACQYDISPNGNEIAVNVFKPGAFFPMSSAINNTPNHYLFEASTETLAHVAVTTEVVQFLRDNPDVLFDLLARVYRGVDGVLRRMAHLMGGDAKTRLLFELLNTAYRFGELQKNGTTTIVLTEGDLARHSGLARETVNRVMQNLKAAELLWVTARGITITDTRKLEALLGSDL